MSPSSLSNKCLALCIALCPFTLPSTASSRLTLPLAWGTCTALAAASAWLAGRSGHPNLLSFQRTIPSLTESTRRKTSAQGSQQHPQKHRHLTTLHQHNSKKGNTQPLVINIDYDQWTQFIYKKTQVKRMDAKTGSNILLFTRNTCQPQRQTLPQSKGLGKGLSIKQT